MATYNDVEEEQTTLTSVGFIERTSDPVVELDGMGHLPIQFLAVLTAQGRKKEKLLLQSKKKPFQTIAE